MAVEDAALRDEGLFLGALAILHRTPAIPRGTRHVESWSPTRSPKQSLFRRITEINCTNKDGLAIHLRAST